MLSDISYPRLDDHDDSGVEAELHPLAEVLTAVAHAWTDGSPVEAEARDWIDDQLHRHRDTQAGAAVGTRAETLVQLIADGTALGEHVDADLTQYGEEYYPVLCWAVAIARQHGPHIEALLAALLGAITPSRQGEVMH